MSLFIRTGIKVNYVSEGVHVDCEQRIPQNVHTS